MHFLRVENTKEEGIRKREEGRGKKKSRKILDFIKFIELISRAN